jgi:hypothetical protein
MLDVVTWESYRSNAVTLSRDELVKNSLLLGPVYNAEIKD